jgi:hypothetical protein
MHTEKFKHDTKSSSKASRKAAFILNPKKRFRI